MAKEVTALIGDGFSADRGETEVVIGFVEGRAPNADRGQPIDHLRQLDLIRHRQHDEVTASVSVKAAARLKTGVTDLHDLIRQREIRAHQRVTIASGNLLLGHSARPQFARVSTGTV